MDLQERLGGYEVTAVPHGRPLLTVVWSESDDVIADDPRPADGALALLDDYRITRVPGRAAS